jgi:hypothetical protein
MDEAKHDLGVEGSRDSWNNTLTSPQSIAWCAIHCLVISAEISTLLLIATVVFRAF